MVESVKAAKPGFYLITSMLIARRWHEVRFLSVLDRLPMGVIGFKQIVILMVVPVLTLIRKRVPASRLLPRFMFISTSTALQIGGRGGWPRVGENRELFQGEWPLLKGVPPYIEHI